MKLESGKLLFENGIELNLKTGETTMRFETIPEGQKSKKEKRVIPTKDEILMELKHTGIFTY